MTNEAESPPVGEPYDFDKELTALVPFLRRIATKFSYSCKVDVDDLVQDTLVAALKYREQFQPGTNIKAWCSLILRNRAFTLRRKNWRERFLEEGEAEHISVECFGTKGLELQEAFAIMQELTPEMRESFFLILAGYSYEEVAEQTGVAIGTVKSRVSRGRSEFCKLAGIERKPLLNPINSSKH